VTIVHGVAVGANTINNILSQNNNNGQSNNSGQDKNNGHPDKDNTVQGTHDDLADLEANQANKRKVGQGPAIESTKKTEQRARTARRRIRNLQDALEEQGKRLEALALLQQLESLGDPVILMRIGALQYELERWDESEATLLKAIKADPNIWVTHFYIGLVYRGQGRLEMAEAAFLQALKNEESSGTLNLLGLVQLGLGHKELAQKSFRRALVVDSHDEEVMYNLATTLDSDARPEAIALFESALEIDPQYSLAHRELGWLHRRGGEFLEAEYHIRRALELDPDDGWCNIYLGNLMWQVGDLEKAELAFQRAIDIWPQWGVGYWCLAHFLECQGQLAKAESLYKKAIEVDPADAQANWRLGNYLKNIGDYDGAKKYLNNALELYPDDKRVREALTNLENEVP
jgi:tetratricopeptide (TPR) repeat protein